VPPHLHPARARQLLAEAGYPQGFGRDVPEGTPRRPSANLLGDAVRDLLDPRTQRAARIST
jgi:ABC-type transport system substrate-binding protein